MKFQLKISKFEIFKNRTYIVPFLPLLTKIVKNHEKNQFSFICYCGGPKKAFGAFIFKEKVKIDQPLKMKLRIWSFFVSPIFERKYLLPFLPFFLTKKGGYKRGMVPFKKGKIFE